MRLDDTEQSDNIEDRRGESGGGGGGGFGLPMGGGGLGIGTIVVLGLIGWALGIDPRLLIGGAEILGGGGTHVQQPMQPAGGQARRTGKPERRHRQVRLHRPRQHRGGVESTSSANPGRPIASRCWCSTPARPARPAAARRRARWARSIARTTRRSISTPRSSARSRPGSSGCEVGSRSCQFSQAYVIAHEVGHHVQNLLDILPKVQQQQAEHGQGRREPPPGRGRAAGRLPRRRMGEPRERPPARMPASRRWSSPATSRRRCTPPPRSATTPCSAGRPAAWCRTASPTAPRSSASAGSRTATARAPSRPATRSGRRICRRGPVPVAVIPGPACKAGTRNS